MKKRIVCFSLVGIVALWGALSHVYHVGRDRGYSQGIQDERSCWILDPVTLDNTTATLDNYPARQGIAVVTARRDLRKHPFSKPARRIILNVTGGTAIRNSMSLPDSH